MLYFANDIQDDLLTFHTRHFQKYPDREIHTAALSYAHGYSSHEAQHMFDDQEDDGLGYYEDGVKRTLTDEQIAMFRHSEVQRLSRDRQVKAENEDAGREDEAAGEAQNFQENINEVQSVSPALKRKYAESEDGNDIEESLAKRQEYENRGA